MRKIAAVLMVCGGLLAVTGAQSPLSPDGEAATRPANRPVAPPPDARITDQGWFAPIPREVPPPELPGEIATAFVIPIHGPITETTYQTIRRKAIRCKGVGAELVVFDLDTPGGSLGATLEIIEVILTELDDIYTVAHVNPKAYSAGAVISLACDEIVIAPTGVIGDAMPIMVGPQGQAQPMGEEMRAKAESAMEGEIRVLADRNGYNAELCQAMIDMTREIWLVRHTETRQLRMVDAGEWRGRVRDLPPGKRAADPAPAGEQAVEPGTPWAYVRTIDPADKIATLTANEAVFTGIATRTVDSRDELLESFNVTGEAVFLEDTWSEQFVTFLTSPAVSGILFFVAILCLYTEINSPGFGVPGIIAVCAFALLFGGRYLIGMAQWWEIGLFVVGLILLALEILVIPGFGVAGVLGLVFIVIGLGAIFVANAPDKLPIPDTDIAWDMFSNGILALAIGFVCAVIGAFIVAQYLPKAPIANKFFLAPADRFAQPPASDASPIQRVQVGDVGVVEGMCRPVGKVRFGDELMPAASEGQMIPSGSRVRVLRRDGNYVVVEKIDEEA